MVYNWDMYLLSWRLYISSRQPRVIKLLHPACQVNLISRHPQDAWTTGSDGRLDTVARFMIYHTRETVTSVYITLDNHSACHAICCNFWLLQNVPNEINTKRRHNLRFLRTVNMGTNKMRLTENITESSIYKAVHNTSEALTLLHQCSTKNNTLITQWGYGD